MYISFIKKLFAVLFVVWIFCFIVLSHNATMATLGLLALSFGLRHGLDADHIVSIDNMTRKFQAENKQCFSTGLFFAIGHSTIVFLLTVFIVFGVKNIHNHFGNLQSFGNIVGTTVSVVFLWLTAGMNVHSIMTSKKNQPHTHVFMHGIFSFIGKNIFNYIDSPQKMFFVGFLFGLGFDTATEVGLLSLAASSSLQGFQITMILLLPILFASGMVLTDSLNSLFMSSLYANTLKQSKNLRFYYHGIVYFSTFLAIAVGFFELIGILNGYHWHLFLINIAQAVNNNFEIMGGIIIFLFLIFWIYAIYKNKILK